MTLAPGCFHLGAIFICVVATVHSGIKILTLLVFALLLTQVSGQALIVSATVLLFSLGYFGADAIARAWQILRRMRWLLLSLLVLYGWYTPGQPLLPAWGSWSPTLLGLETALLRCTALMLMGAAVALLLATTPLPSMVAGLLWLTAPLRWLGFPYQRFALRVALTLQAVTELRAQSSEVSALSGSRLWRISETLSARYESVVRDAALQPEQTISVALCGAPAWYHWLFPVLVGLLVLL